MDYVKCPKTLYSEMQRPIFNCCRTAAPVINIRFERTGLSLFVLPELKSFPQSTHFSVPNNQDALESISLTCFEISIFHQNISNLILGDILWIHEQNYLWKTTEILALCHMPTHIKKTINSWWVAKNSCSSNVQSCRIRSDVSRTEFDFSPSLRFITGPIKWLAS